MAKPLPFPGYFVRPKGNEFLAIRQYRTAEGRRKQQWLGKKPTYEEAADLCIEDRDKRAKGFTPHAAGRVADVLEGFMKDEILPLELAEGTMRPYRKHIEAITQKFGQLKYTVFANRPGDISRWLQSELFYSKVLSNGKENKQARAQGNKLLDTNTRRAYGAFLKRICDWEQQRSGTRSPFWSVKIPKLDVKDFPVPSVVDALKIVATAPVEWRLAFWLAFQTGKRQGELAALTREDFNLEENTIEVKRAIKREKGENVEGPTKTRKRQTLGLAPFTKLLYLQHLAQIEAYENKRHKTVKYLFHKKGERRNPNDLGAAFRAVAGELKMPYTLHDCRHWAATHSGSLELAQALLGHGSKKMTERYRHVEETDAARIAGQQLEDLLKGALPGVIDETA